MLAASKNGNKLFSDEPVTPISNQRTILRTKGSQYLIRAKRKTEKQTDQYLQSISPNLQDAASRIKFRAPQIETPTRKSSLILFPTEQPPKVNIVQESQHYSQIPCFSLPLPNTRSSANPDHIIRNKARHGRHQCPHFIVKSLAFPSKVLRPHLRNLVVHPLVPSQEVELVNRRQRLLGRGGRCRGQGWSAG